MLQWDSLRSRMREELTGDEVDAARVRDRHEAILGGGEIGRHRFRFSSVRERFSPHHLEAPIMSRARLGGLEQAAGIGEYEEGPLSDVGDHPVRS